MILLFYLLKLNNDRFFILTEKCKKFVQSIHKHKLNIKQNILNISKIEVPIFHSTRYRRSISEPAV